jgi:hypothetical protein
MAPRLSHRRWLLRDIPHLGALSVWALAGFTVLAFCFEGPAMHRIAAAVSRSILGARPSADAGNSPSMYTGSIVFVPPRGEVCDQWKFDNRNGALWDGGQVSCRPASATSKPDEVTSAARMMAIGKAFKGD